MEKEKLAFDNERTKDREKIAQLQLKLDGTDSSKKYIVNSWAY